jgi:hypothetical protein
MAADAKIPESFSLKRWSRRKLEAARVSEAVPDPPSAAPVAAAPSGSVADPPSASPPAVAADLPPIESLTIDSDFRAFLQPKVAETLKRQALKKLFGDPHFNVMDGLDVYIDDYSKPDPIPADMVRQLVQARYIFDPPQTRINEQGFVEDVPPVTAEAGGPAIDGEADLPAMPVEAESGALELPAGIAEAPPATINALGSDDAGGSIEEGSTRADDASRDDDASKPAPQ